MPKRSSKQKDTQQLARSVLDAVVPDASAGSDEEKKVRSEAAAMLGRIGGLKGGKARANKLSAVERKSIAKKAAAARWKRT